MARVFLLSPAHTGGLRAAMLMREAATFDLAQKVRGGNATLGEIFTFCSGLYFRGKVAYAEKFGSAPEGVAGAQVITAGKGLMPVTERVSLEMLKAFAEVPVEAGEVRFTRPLARAVKELAKADCEVVLLGSVATGKYVDTLLPLLGERLLFPKEFVGRGDMSRGGLMLRCAAEGRELEYVPVAGAVRKGTRPPKLAPQRRYSVG